MFNDTFTLTLYTFVLSIKCEQTLEVTNYCIHFGMIVLRQT